MEIYFFQIILLIVGVTVLSYFRFGLRYICVFLAPLYTMALVFIFPVTTYINSFQLATLAVLVWIIVSGHPLSKSAVVKGAILLAPFLLSLIYNSFFFTPIEVWEINSVTNQRVVLRSGLNMTNFTQLIYVVFGVAVFVIFASIQLDLKKLKRVIDYSIYFVCFAGAVQVVSFYLDLNWLFRFLFNNIRNDMADQVFHLWGFKRISATFSESSYFSQYAFYTLTFYLHRFGYRPFLRSKAVQLLLITMLLSTSTTAYVAIAVLLAIMFLWYSTQQEKMYYYVIFMIAAPVLAYLLYAPMLEYWGAKEGSNNIRMIVSWIMPKNDIIQSPFFGYGFGTSKPLFIHTQLLHAIGFVGVLIFLVGLILGNGRDRATSLYLVGVGVLGAVNFELARAELWLYFGLLYNASLRAQVADLNSTAHLRSPRPSSPGRPLRA